eukprot:gene30573-35589_t
MLTQIGTPVYMSPELLGMKKTNAGYDARKADVWACGVLLFVMLLGMFPFEHQENPDPNSDAAHTEVWLQQIRCTWREIPRVSAYVAKLSPDCRDLLDRMFELDMNRRITVEGVKAHKWLQKKLPAHYEMSLSAIATEQAFKDQMVDPTSKMPLSAIATEQAFKDKMVDPTSQMPLSAIATEQAFKDKMVDPTSQAAKDKLDEALVTLINRSVDDPEADEKTYRIDLTRLHKRPSKSGDSSLPFGGMVASPSGYLANSKISPLSLQTVMSI